MKKLKLIPILALLFMVNVASMCSDDDSSSSSSTPNQVTDNVSGGTWRVSLYNEDGTVKTSDFSGYAFIFDADGSVTAIKSETIQIGDWSSYNDSGSTKFDLVFAALDGPFESISEDWNVLSSSSTVLSLKHVSGGDGSIDLLTFTKI
ncbi:hypothetical protein G4D82_03900 [Flavobacterium sp. CYK-4]|uniref:hypothetical protein n=1 Tax=Flavobacterium lotistagni TaxID=2709660 RepID=UPI00140CB380|nr:hypothetical protein [Flavobacterium lotistagni]NHM06353.1 hypothetical protein [Flavobacterium lotistagni]